MKKYTTRKCRECDWVGSSMATVCDNGHRAGGNPNLNSVESYKVKKVRGNFATATAIKRAESQGFEVVANARSTLGKNVLTFRRRRTAESEER